MCLAIPASTYRASPILMEDRSAFRSSRHMATTAWHCKSEGSLRPAHLGESAGPRWHKTLPLVDLFGRSTIFEDVTSRCSLAAVPRLRARTKIAHGGLFVIHHFYNFQWTGVIAGGDAAR